jgi:hypothetical protein
MHASKNDVRHVAALGCPSPARDLAWVQFYKQTAPSRRLAIQREKRELKAGRPPKRKSPLHQND